LPVLNTHCAAFGRLGRVTYQGRQALSAHVHMHRLPKDICYDCDLIVCIFVCVHMCRLQKDIYYDYDLEDEMKKRDAEKRKQQTRGQSQ